MNGCDGMPLSRRDHRLIQKISCRRHGRQVIVAKCYPIFSSSSSSSISFSFRVKMVFIRGGIFRKEKIENNDNIR